MEKKEKVYEAAFIITPEAASKWAELEANLKRLIEKHEGQVIAIVKWEDRKLAYKIKKQQFGSYVFAYFKSEPSKVNDLYRECLLTDYILRTLILVEDTAKKVSASFRKIILEAPQNPLPAVDSQPS